MLERDGEQDQRYGDIHGRLGEKAQSGGDAQEDEQLPALPLPQGGTGQLQIADRQEENSRQQKLGEGIIIDGGGHCQVHRQEGDKGRRTQRQEGAIRNQGSHRPAYNQQEQGAQGY